MPFSTLQNSKVEPLVTNVLLAYTNNDFIADMVLPSLPVKEEAGKIGEMGTNHLRIYDSKRSLSDEGQHRMEFVYTQDKSYMVEYYDLESYIPDRLINQAQDPFDPKRDAGISLLQALKLERENALAAAMTSTAVVTNNVTLSGTSQFNDYVNSSPEDVIETGRNTIQLAIGREANSMIIGRKVFNTLKRHPFFLEMVKGVKVISASVLMELLKDYFEVKNVFIAKAIKISSEEGQAVTKAAVWNNDIVLFYRPDSASMFEPSFGYQFTLTGQNMRASTRRHTNDVGDIEKVEWAYQDKVLDPNCAYLIKNAVA